MITTYNNIDQSQFFKRGHHLQQSKGHIFKTDSTEKALFTERVINDWNSLPNKIVNALRKISRNSRTDFGHQNTMFLIDYFNY